MPGSRSAFRFSQRTAGSALRLERQPVDDGRTALSTAGRSHLQEFPKVTFALPDPRQSDHVRSADTEGLFLDSDVRGPSRWHIPARAGSACAELGRRALSQEGDASVASARADRRVSADTRRRLRSLTPGRCSRTPSATSVVGVLRRRRATGAEYHVCVALRPVATTPRMRLETGTIPGGLYRRVRLQGEPPEIYARIATTMAELEASTDPRRGATARRVLPSSRRDRAPRPCQRLARDGRAHRGRPI